MGETVNKRTGTFWGRARKEKNKKWNSKGRGRRVPRGLVFETAAWWDVPLSGQERTWDWSYPQSICHTVQSTHYVILPLSDCNRSLDSVEIQGEMHGERRWSVGRQGERTILDLRIRSCLVPLRCSQSLDKRTTHANDLGHTPFLNCY